MKFKAKSSRRAFLKKTGRLAVSSIAFPYIISSSAMGNAGQIPPSNRINLGFIGLGRQARYSHLQSMLHRSQVQIVALCDVERHRLQVEKGKVDTKYSDRFSKPGYQACHTYSDFREMLGRKDIDAVVIATPDHWHAIQCVEAAKAGKDIYCEKPLAKTVYECRAIAKAVKQHSRIFQTGSQQRSEYQRNFIHAAELVRNGRIGKVKTIGIGVNGFPGPYNFAGEPIPEGLDWDMWIGPSPMVPYTKFLLPGYEDKFWAKWRFCSEFGNGGFTDMGAHHFDIAQWVLAMDDSGPVEVIPPHGSEYKNTTYKYANGVVMYTGARSDLVIEGTEGTINVSRRRMSTTPGTLMTEKFGPNEIHLGRQWGHHDDWLNSIKTRQETICTAEIGCRSATVCLLGVIANQLQRALKWDPENEKFINDTQADKLLSRPMRSPWRI